ncbi:MAG: 4,5-DOPA dioxygenase extradiol [Eubacteriales bacterium]
MMPVIFVGHGSPMNAIEENEYTQGWREIAASIPKPVAILSISAHWVTSGTKVSVLENPETIHDFYGFPKALFDMEYPAAGSPHFAAKTIDLLGNADADKSWGLDHGTWSVLSVMYPNANIPVFQLSIDAQASPAELFEIGNKLKPLRENGVLIFGSGNVVHNLGLVDFTKQGGFDWANKFDETIKNNILKRDFENILNYRKLGDIARIAVPTTEHFNPLLYVLGASDSADEITVYNNSSTLGSLSMTSYVFS